MFGRMFESLYRGSMVGSGSAVFAVWGYVITNMKPDAVVGAQVELNPKLLAFILGEDEAVVERVIEHLCSPDPKSTSKVAEGRRLMRLGQFAFQVVNGAKYMAIRNERDRREYFRVKKREYRAKQHGHIATTAAQREAEKLREQGKTEEADQLEARAEHLEHASRGQ